MAFTDDDLAAAAAAGVLTPEAHQRLVAFLSGRLSTAPAREPLPGPARTGSRFDLTHLLWYTGTLIVMGAMGLFSNTAFNALGGLALAATALLYGVGFAALGDRLWRKGETTPGGLCIAIAVAMVPLAIYGIQDRLHLWAEGDDPGRYRRFFTYVNGGWFWMELGTVLAALAALRLWPFPFILFVAAVALWFMSMDLAMWVTQGAYGDYETRRRVSLIFGIAMIAVAWAIDLKSRGAGPDFAFWLHLFGAAAFWGGLTFQSASNEIGRALYCLINIGLLAFAVFLGRRIYAVFGAFGIAAYLGHLAWTVFPDALMFSFALSGVGLGVIWLGLLFHRNAQRLAAWMDRSLPSGLRALRPAQA